MMQNGNILETIWRYVFWGICTAVFFFLMAPLVIIIPLSFNAEAFFTFSEGMLNFEASAYSLRWYEEVLTSEAWGLAIRNSLIIAVSATILATILGTLAAVGLSRAEMPAKPFIMAILISPMVVPLIITATSIFFFYAAFASFFDGNILLTGTLPGLILAHTALGTPFVVITVTATLVGFDKSLIRAGAMLGANPWTVFFKITLPLILPGIISGALFAFVTSFDEVVVVLFIANPQQQTIPWKMWSGIREQISPAILAVATLLIAFSIVFLGLLEFLRRRSERLRGMSPS